jgi:hypothetical protein
MRTSSWLLVITVSLFLGSALIAQQGTKTAPPQSTAGKRAAPQPAGGKSSGGGPYRPVATIKDLMDGMIDPAGDMIFDAVSTVVTPTGTVEKSPKTDDEWKAVRNNALIIIEGANLLMMPGRHIAAGSDKAPPVRRGKDAEEFGGELNPAQIEVRVARDRPMWNKLARGLQVAATSALKAAETKDAQALLASGDTIDDACETCHLRYWYPDQLALLDKADRLLRQRK